MKKFSVAMLALGAASLMFAADAAAGKATYDASCKKCHGADGTPVAAIAKMLKVEMKNLGDAAVQAKKDADLSKNIVEGVGKMKAVALSPADAANVVAHVRTLKH